MQFLPDRRPCNLQFLPESRDASACKKVNGAIVHAGEHTKIYLTKIHLTKRIENTKNTFTKIYSDADRKSVL